MIAQRTRSIRSSFGGGGLVAALLLWLTTPLPGQTGAGGTGLLAGSVVKDSAGVGGVAVTLHRVSSSASGAIDTRTTDPSGGFRFVLPPADTASFTVFFVTADYLSVRYFGDPVHRDRQVADYRVEVFDTTSMLPGALRTARRDIVLMPETEGGWQVNEIIRVRNTARKTLVAREDRPAWQFRLPEGAVDFQAGEGDETDEPVELRGDWVFLRTALTPGDRELFVRYRIPADRRASELVLAEPTDSLNIFVRQPAPELRITGMATTKVINVENERFVQYGAADLQAQSTVRMEWSSPGAPPVDPVMAALAVAVLILGVGTWAAFRNRQGPRPAPAAASAPANHRA